MSERKPVNVESIELIQNEKWLRQKIEEDGYSSSRLAKELGIYRASIERYRVKFGIEQKLSPKELTTKNYQHKTQEQKQTILEKRKTTNKELFGVDNTFQSEEKKQKAKETMLERYGVERALQHPEYLAKQQSTMLERYGVKFAVHNKTLYQKQLDTMYDRYGQNPGSLPLNIKKAKNTNLNKFGREHVNQQHIPLETLTNFNNRDWLIDQHHTQKKTLTQIANETGCWMTTVRTYCLQLNVEIKYYFESAQQREVSDWLVSLDIQVHTNIRNKIKNQELDIYLPEFNLAIEYCGVFWHSDAHERMTPNYHRNKMRCCDEIGIRLLTIYEDEWVYKQDIVKQKILTIIGKNTKSVYARKCSVISIDNTDLKNAFLDKYHIQGTGPGSITYGLVYENELVGMMTFIARKDGKYELNRYASSIRVVGGFQKLLVHFKRHQPDWTEILSFADLRWSQGNMYNISGFMLDKILSPDYRYVFGNTTFHKFGFRRRALLGGKIPNFDPTLSEVQNMRNAGYYRIFNCGLLRYVLSK